MKPWITIAVAALAGMAGGFLAGRSAPTAAAQSRVVADDSRWIVRTMTIQPSQEAFVVFDRSTERAAFYAFNGTNLTLLAVREVNPDLALASFGKQSPDPDEVRRRLNERTKNDK